MIAGTRTPTPVFQSHTNPIIVIFPHPLLLPLSGLASINNLDKLRFATGPRSTASLRLEMQKTMQEHAAVYRTQGEERGRVREKRRG